MGNPPFNEPLEICRCNVCGNEYVKTWRKELIVKPFLDLDKEVFIDVVKLMLSHFGHNPFSSEYNDDNNGSIILESHITQKGVWKTKSWELFLYIRTTKTVPYTEVKRFFDLCVSDGAQQGTIITFGDFAWDAVSWAKTHEMNLINGKEFLKMARAAYTIRLLCKKCNIIPAKTRIAFQGLKKSLDAFNKNITRVSGAWTAPLLTTKFEKELISKLVSLYTGNSRARSNKIEPQVIKYIVDLGSSLLKAGSSIRAIDRLTDENMVSDVKKRK